MDNMSKKIPSIFVGNVNINKIKREIFSHKLAILYNIRNVFA